MTAANGLRALQPSLLIPSSTPTMSSHTVDASNEGVAFGWQAEYADAITHLGFRYGARTGTPPTYIIGIEGVSASTGQPDGTYKTNGGNCSATFTPPASTAWDGTWQWVALSNTYTPSVGEFLMTTIRYSSGTIDASNFSSFTSHITNSFGYSWPTAWRNTSGTWAVQSGLPPFGVRTANYRYGYILPNFYSTRSASTVGNRVAAKFSLPSGFGDTYKVIGFRTTASIAQVVGRNPIAGVWSSSSSLATVTLDTDIVAISTYRPLEIYFTSAPTLSFGTDYYVGFEVADATSAGVILYGTQYADSADGQSTDGGSYCVMSSYNGSSWTDDATVRPWIELIFEDITEPTGSGGALVLPRQHFHPIGAW